MSQGLARPVLWALPGGAAPYVRSTWTNVADLGGVQFYRATSRNAADSAWTLAYTKTKPEVTTYPFVTFDDDTKLQSETWYYRAAQVAPAAIYCSAWSNVIRNDVPTFLFDLRDKEGFLRGIDFEEDSEAAQEGVSWFEAMAIMWRCHEQIIEMLRDWLSAADVIEVFKFPPADLAAYAKAKVSREILREASLTADIQKETMERATYEMRDSLSAMKRDSMLILSNGEEYVISPNVLRPG